MVGCDSGLGEYVAAGDAAERGEPSTSSTETAAEPDTRAPAAFVSTLAKHVVRTTVGVRQRHGGDALGESDVRDRRTDRQRRTFQFDNLTDPARLGVMRDGGLVRLDLQQVFPSLDVLTVSFEPTPLLRNRQVDIIGGRDRPSGGAPVMTELATPKLSDSME